MSMPADPNAQQITYWNDEAGPKWVAMQERLDAQLEPFGRLVVDRLRLVPGERVLDVGCGCGATTRALAARVGPTGAAVGVDVSAPMLAHARTRPTTGPQPSYVRADAARWRPDERFDAVFSRFGVMFFADPAAAFSNLHALLRPGGRLAFICWRAFEQNQWVYVPLMAALPFLPPLPPMPPGAPGPFAFADPVHVRGVVERGGFVDVALEPQDLEAVVGGRGADLDAATEFLLQMGPTARLLAGVEPDVRSRIAAAVREAIAPYHEAGGVRMGSAAWVVSARRA
jgi:SAM-dependent methyltransferase